MNPRYLVPAAVVVAIAAWTYLAGGMGRFLFYGLPMLLGMAGAALLARNAPGRSWRGHVFTALRIYFAFHLIWTSVRYWMTDMQPVVPDPIGGPFIASLEAMRLFPGIKTLEGIVGLALLFNLFVPLALVIEMPISITIFWLNVIIVSDSYTRVTGTFELAVNSLLLLAYLHHYRAMLVPRAEPFPGNWPEPAAIAADGRVAPAGDQTSA